jgi:hypothetical protein
MNHQITQITGKICVNMFKRLELVPDTDEFLHPSNLIGIKISREDLLKEGQIEQISELIQELRGFYSASGMSCLRANRKQKTPVINTLRQVCKANGLLMKPYSKSQGYYPNGKKKLYRWFEIHALDEDIQNQVSNVTEPVPQIQGNILELEDLHTHSSAQ